MRPDSQQTPTINVTGDVVLTRKPDVGFITMFIRAEGVLLEDAVRESTNKVDQVLQAIRSSYEIRDIQIEDVYLGEGKPALGLARDKTYPPRPEVVKSLLATIPANAELAIKIVDTATRMGCLMANATAFPPSAMPRSVIQYGLAEDSEVEQDAIAHAIATERKSPGLAQLRERGLVPSNRCQ